MAHELAFVGGKAQIAYVGEKPWHGLGTPLTRDASIEVWAKESGLNYEIKRTPVKFEVPVAGTKSTLNNLGLGNQAVSKEFHKREVLYRATDGMPLSIVSSEYNIVQPPQVLEFFRDLVAEGGGKMFLETAGVLFNGTRYWGMANTNMEADVIKNDRIRARLLLVTSCDGTLATTAKYIAERVVCNNTLKVALGEDANAKQQVRVTHGGTFNPEKIKETLGLIDTSWDNFMSNIKKMAAKKITDNDAKEYIAELMLNQQQRAEMKTGAEIHKRVQAKLDTIYNMYKGDGMGADLVTGTLWGALNAVTEFADHRIGQIDDNKLWNSWFGYTDNLKSKAFELALDMV